MKKLITLLAIGCLAAPSWSIGFNWLTDPGDTPLTFILSGSADGGDPTRFLPIAQGGLGLADGVAGHADDGINYVSGAYATNGDFFSVFRVLSIHETNNAGNEFWNAAGAGYNILGVFYGANDNTATYTSPGSGVDDFISLQSTGGFVDLFLSVPTLDTSNGLSDIIDGGYATISTLDPLAQYELRARGASSSDAGFTDVRQINVTTPTATNFNNGNFYGDIKTGFSTQEQILNTNSLNSGANADDIFGADAFFKYNMIADLEEPCGTGQNEHDCTLADVNQLISNGTFPLNFNGSINTLAQPIPEPSTLLLLGTGLLGMVGYVRRRNAA